MVLLYYYYVFFNVLHIVFLLNNYHRHHYYFIVVFLENIENDSKFRVPTPLENSGKSWNFYWKISRTWKVLENNLGTGKSWKTICKILENPIIS